MIASVAQIAPNINLYLLAPELSLVLLAMIVILVDLVVRRHMAVVGTALVGLAIPAGFTFALGATPHPTQAFFNMLLVDQYAIFFELLFLLIGVITILASYDYVVKEVKAVGEFYALLLLSVAGMMLMASTGELISIYISLELTSFPLYIMAGLLRHDDRSAEAAVKYVLLGAMSSAILLYGLALLYGLTGTTDLASVAATLRAGFRSNNLLLLLADVLIFAGFGFKISAVPFHMWAPDIYEGAPTPATAFFSVGSKAAGFAALIRIVIDAGLGGMSPTALVALVSFIAILTMTLGNVVAIVQTNVKRMMAYSSIGQAGYILVGFAASLVSGKPDGNSAVLFFLLVYVVTNLGAFAGIIALANATGRESIRDFQGMHWRNPLLALGTAICLLSLAGMPPMAGFLAKVYIFAAAWQQGLTWLVVIAVLNSAVSLVYYLRIVRMMYFSQPVKPGYFTASGSLSAALGISAIGVLVMTPLVGVLLAQAQPAANSLFSFLVH
jgi:NADH-quinone oxidoreductase subunit N